MTHPPAIIVETPIVGSVVAIPSHRLAEIDAALARAESFRGVTPASLVAADEACGKLASIRRELEIDRKGAKAEPLELCRAIDARAAEQDHRLEQALGRLAPLVRTCHQEIAAEARRVEQERQRIAEAEAAAARDAAAAAERAAAVERELDDLELAAIDAEEAAIVAGMRAEVRAPVEAAVAHADAVTAEADVLFDQPTPVAPKLRSVGGRKKREVVIDDPSAVPDSIMGTDLWVLDMVTIRRLALGGLRIPGVRVTEGESTTTRGIR